MPAPERRDGIDSTDFARQLAQLDRARETVLRRTTDLADIGGIAIVWRREKGKIVPGTLQIQPGISDDLESLLSALAREIAWPGVPDAPAEYHSAVAAWARVWQSREQADLRLELHWDEPGTFTGRLERCPLSGSPTVVADQSALIEMLDRLAIAPKSSASPHALLLEGNRAYREGDYERARTLYAAALHDLPHHPQGQHNLALALAHLGEWEAAAEAMQQARALTPADEEIGQEYLALETDAGIKAVEQGDLPRAAGHFLRILAVQSDEPTALANLGNIRLREGRHREAGAIFRRFLRHHPRHPAADTIRLALDAMDGH